MQVSGQIGRLVSGFKECDDIVQKSTQRLKLIDKRTEDTRLEILDSVEEFRAKITDDLANTLSHVNSIVT